MVGSDCDSRAQPRVRRSAGRSTMDMRQKYDKAIQVAKGVRMQGSAEERNGKLYFTGVVNSEEEKNQIWNALKTVPDWQTDIIADIRVQASAAPPQGSAQKPV